MIKANKLKKTAKKTKKATKKKATKKTTKKVAKKKMVKATDVKFIGDFVKVSEKFYKKAKKKEDIGIAFSLFVKTNNREINTHSITAFSQVTKEEVVYHIAQQYVNTIMSELKASKAPVTKENINAVKKEMDKKFRIAFTEIAENDLKNAMK